MLNPSLLRAASAAILISSLIALGTPAHAFVCTDADAAVDWLGVGADLDGGPCPVTASVTDGVGVATASAAVSSPDTIGMDFSFTFDGGSSFFSGDVESMVVATFDVGAAGAELVFESSGSATGFYSLAGPGTAVGDAPLPASPLSLTTPGSYEISVRHLYNGGSATSSFFGSTEVTLVPLGVPAPTGRVVPMVVALGLAAIGAWLGARR